MAQKEGVAVMQNTLKLEVLSGMFVQGRTHGREGRAEERDVVYTRSHSERVDGQDSEALGAVAKENRPHPRAGEWPDTPGSDGS